MGGGKGGTSTSTVSIPPEVLARYNAVNTRAEQVAETPFQPYTGEFVAPITQTQQAGIDQTQKYAEAAQPYYQQAAAQTQASSAPLTAEQIQRYQNPYIQSVIDPTLKALQQQQGVDLARQQAQQIRSGSFGGDRSGISRAVLQGQQELAQAQAISPLYQQGYQQALQTAQQQQQLGLTGAQQLAGIGTGAQQAGLQGAQAVIGAGTLEQQTAQALDTAKYQQALQERGYPFQVAQFLANIAEGTGALSGSTTTTTQPTSFFSDERLKTDIKKIATAKNGLPIYSFKYKDDPKTTHIGFIAQDVEKKNPEAVGLSGGYKTVDYGKALRQARANGGGLLPISMGGAVGPADERMAFAGGGGPMTLDQILAQQHAFQSGQDPNAAPSMPYAGMAQKGLNIPMQKSPAARAGLMKASAPPQQPSGLQSAMQNIASAGKTAETLSSGYDWAKKGLVGTEGTDKNKPTGGPLGYGGKWGEKDPNAPKTDAASPPPAQTDTSTDTSLWDKFKSGLGFEHGGGVMPRHHYGAGGGYLDPYKPPTSESMIPEEVMEDSESTRDKAAGQAVKPDGSRGGGGGGGGLGSALGTAAGIMNVGKGIGSFMSWLPTLFLNDGGRVRYYNGGLVPRQGFANPTPTGAVQQQDQQDPLAGYDPRDLAIRTIASETGGHPDETAGIAAVIGNRKASGKWGDDYRSVVTAKNQFEPWNNPSAANYPLKIDPASDRYKQAASALDRFESEKYDPTQGATHFWAPKAQAALGREAPSWGREGGVDLGATRFHKLDLSGQPAQVSGQYPLQKQVEGGFGAAKDLANSMVPLTYKGEERKGGWGDFLTSRDFILPLMAGLGTMASSPSRYLGAAILQGLGGAASAYQGVQAGQLARDKSVAEQMATTSGLPSVVGGIEGGKPKFGAKYDYMSGPTLRPDRGDGTTQPTQAGGLAPVTAVQAPQAPVIQPIAGPSGGYSYTINPTQTANNRLMSAIAPDANNVPTSASKQQIRALIDLSPDLQAREANDARVGDTRANFDTAGQRIALNNLHQAFEGIPNSGFFSKGPGFDERQTLLNLADYWNRVAPGVFGDVDISSLKNSEILNKLRTIDVKRYTPPGGSNAGFIQEEMARALPSGHMTEAAGVNVMASMLLANAREEDFKRYYNKYRGQHNTALLSQENFDHDMGQYYNNIKPKLIEALTPRGDIGQPSPAEYLRKHPETAAQFEKHYNAPGLARIILGG